MAKIICIDPGHGGYDPGAVHGDACEKDITLHIGLQLRDILKRLGFQVVMTREIDDSPGGYKEVNADLNERCRIADNAHANILLSIHVNAGDGHGAEIYVAGDGGPVAKLARGIVDNVAVVCGYHGQPVRDGGRNGENWRVIVGTDDSVNAMLLEVGFIDTDDLQKIQAHIDEFAPRIARAFCSFYGVSYPADPSAPAPKQAAPTLDPLAAQVAIDQLAAITKAASPAALVACNFAANSAREASAKPIMQTFGNPDKESAGRLCGVLTNLWHMTDRPAVRDAYALMADSLRKATGC
jgi:N-acetylmuramoyl-L-alanine amidase